MVKIGPPELPLKFLIFLTSSWPRGEVSGLRARGGFEVTFSWKESRLEQVEVLSRAGENCKLRYRDKSIEIGTTVGGKYVLDGNLILISK